jgi:hypothetical protein
MSNSGVFKNSRDIDDDGEAAFAEPDYATLPAAELNRLAETFRRKAHDAATLSEEREWTGRERNCRTQVNRLQHLS